MAGLQERQIRATQHVDDKGRRTIIVYQAYNSQIARAAVASNSFCGPLQAGLWSKERMTWIKPSAVWMGYRCGWGIYKDKNQTNILALTIPLDKLYELLSTAVISSHGKGAGGKATAKGSSVVVQWDPERFLAPNNGTDKKKKPIAQTPKVDKNVYTKKSESGRDIRSIQIGLRREAVAMLLDPTVVIRIEDVTEKFHACGHALAAGDETAAMSSLEIDEQPLHDVPLDIQSILCMT